MKLNIVLIVAILSCAFAEDKEEEKPNLIQEWKTIYGKHGIDAYYPLRFQLSRYSYPLVQPSLPLVNPSYPLVNPSYPLVNPSYPLVNPSYPLVNPSYPLVQPSYSLVQPTYPLVQPQYPIYQPPHTLPAVRVKASYDPENFNDMYGYYPAV